MGGLTSVWAEPYRALPWAWITGYHRVVQPAGSWRTVLPDMLNMRLMKEKEKEAAQAASVVLTGSLLNTTHGRLSPPVNTNMMFKLIFFPSLALRSDPERKGEINNGLCSPLYQHR